MNAKSPVVGMGEGFRKAVGQAVLSHVLVRGGDTAPVLNALGWSDGIPQDLDQSHRISSAQLCAALKAVCVSLRDEHAGWQVGMAMLPARMDALGYALMTAPNALCALQIYEELQALMNAGLTLGHSADGAIVSVQVRHCSVSLPREYAFWSFILGWRLSLLRSASPSFHIAQEVALPCPPPASDQMIASLVAAPVRFHAHAYEERWWVSRLKAPSPESNRDIHAVMLAMARREWREAFDSAHMIAELKRVISRALDRGVSPTLAELMPHMAESNSRVGSIGARQWQRRLAAHQRGFRDLVAEVRQERALAQLRSTDRPLADIAAEAGYAELSSFHRAVRRWTGSTPMRVRLDVRGGEPVLLADQLA